MSIIRRINILATYQDIKLGHATASYIIRNGQLEIASVRVPQKYRGHGEAKAVMQKLIDLADSQRLPAKLLASPLDKKTVTQGLVKFYQQFGFKLTGQTGNLVGDPWMLRPAKGVK